MFIGVFTFLYPSLLVVGSSKVNLSKSYNGNLTQKITYGYLNEVFLKSDVFLQHYNLVIIFFYFRWYFSTKEIKRFRL